MVSQPALLKLKEGWCPRSSSFDRCSARCPSGPQVMAAARKNGEIAKR